MLIPSKKAVFYKKYSYEEKYLLTKRHTSFVFPMQAALEQIEILMGIRSNLLKRQVLTLCIRYVTLCISKEYSLYSIEIQSVYLSNTRVNTVELQLLNACMNLVDGKEFHQKTFLFP